MTAPEPDGGPTVSVCMPMARPAHEVERSVRSVLAQDFGDFELLIGDETGAAASLVAALADPRIDYRHNPERLGFSANHVALLDRARGRYLTVLHDDDRWEPTFLSRLVAVLEGDGEIGLACCGVTLDRGGGDGTGSWPIPLRPGRNDGLLDLVLAEEWFMLLDNALWRRQLWAGPAREWPDLCCGDLQFFLSAAEARWPVSFLDRALVVYRLHEGQSGAWRGSDHGLGVAEDVLAFWDGWLRGRPEEQIALTAPRPRPVAPPPGPGSRPVRADARGPGGRRPGRGPRRARPPRPPPVEDGGGPAEPVRARRGVPQTRCHGDGDVAPSAVTPGPGRLGSPGSSRRV